MVRHEVASLTGLIILLGLADTVAGVMVDTDKLFRRGLSLDSPPK
jgi:hypothetical protein